MSTENTRTEWDVFLAFLWGLFSGIFLGIGLALLKLASLRGG